MDRRRFLQNTGLALGATALPAISTEATPFIPDTLDTWADVRAQFSLNPARIHMAQMLLASHPIPVRAEIEKHRRAFDENPVEYWEETYKTAEVVVQQAAARYLQCAPEEVALTDSTCMGLATMYNGLKLKPGDEILTTTHDHYATEKSLEFSAARNGAILRRVTLYQQGSAASVDEIVGTISKNIQPRTRVVAVTWVHSSTGVKLPIHDIAVAIAKANAGRNAGNRIYFCVDGVHAFGVDNITMADLGCDFFAAGTHKWMFGPRGTGILFAKKDAADFIAPTIPSFSYNSYGAWLDLYKEKQTFGEAMSPGGFHSFEHRYALNAAFDFHLKIGKAKVQDYTHGLSTQLKDGISGIKHIKLHTPKSSSLSAGINCFEVEGMSPEDVIKKLLAKGIVGSTTPYKTSYARLTPSMVNTEAEVRTVISALEMIKA